MGEPSVYVFEVRLRRSKSRAAVVKREYLPTLRAAQRTAKAWLRDTSYVERPVVEVVRCYLGEPLSKSTLCDVLNGTAAIARQPVGQRWGLRRDRGGRLEPYCEDREANVVV